MLEIGVTGASGRMGKEIIQALIERNHKKSDVVLSAAIAHSASTSVGKNATTNAGIDGSSTNPMINIVAEPIDAKFDVLIDFSLIESTLLNIKHCVAEKKAIVIGTTGFSAEQKQVIADAAKHIPIVFAPNMSVAVNLSFHLIETAARVIGEESDIEIIEAHHKHKVDAPSGTALRMGEIIADTLDRRLEDCAIYGREGHTGERDPKTIGFSTIRAGSIIGDHTVMFADDSERLEITHKSQSRSTYAMGSIRAARWLSEKPAGLYDMQDVLGLR